MNNDFYAICIMQDIDELCRTMKYNYSTGSYGPARNFCTKTEVVGHLRKGTRGKERKPGILK